MRRREVEKLRIQEPQYTQIFMKLVWKIHEVVGDKGS
jgi:hypothetical protein